MKFTVKFALCTLAFCPWGPAPSAVSSTAPRADAVYSCIMHVHSSMSSGSYSLPELTRVAEGQGVDAIFLSDNLMETIEYSLPFLRHVFWAGVQQRPSVMSVGWKRYHAAVAAENRRQSGVLYVPGVELSPRFYWSGSLLGTNLICHNHQRDLIVMGTRTDQSLRNVPVARGFVPGRDTVWILATRTLLVLFALSCLGLLFLPRRMALRSGYSPGAIARAFFFVLVLPLGLVMVAVDFAAGRMTVFDIYSPDDPGKFEQRVLDYLNSKQLPCFWAHPEAYDHAEYSVLGARFSIDTRPHPDILLATRGYTGFAGLNEGENKLVEPGSAWDQALGQYIVGARDRPVWCFGEMLYHYEGQAGKKLANVENMVWAPEKTAQALLDSVSAGRFYARINRGSQSLVLDRWDVNGIGSGRTIELATNTFDIALGVSSKAPGEVLDIVLIRNGEIVKRTKMKAPFDLRFEDSLPSGLSNAYYRALVCGTYPLRLASNPIFVRR